MPSFVARVVQAGQLVAVRQLLDQRLPRARLVGFLRRSLSVARSMLGVDRPAQMLQ